MNIEEKIRNNAASFDDMKMPEGSRERFLERLTLEPSMRPAEPTVRQTEGKLRSLRPSWIAIAAAAAVALILVVSGLKFDLGDAATQVPQTADNELIKMRQIYDEKVESAIINLENLMENVDDSTRVQINSVIRELTDMNDVFAEMAPMPEERQMAIVEQIYDNNLRTLELITDKFNK